MVPALASVGRIPDGTTVDLPGRGSTYVYRFRPVRRPHVRAAALPGLHRSGDVVPRAWTSVREFGRVVVFDQRCHGQGILPPRMLLEDCADDVAALADVLDIPSFVPVGYSMGSLVAQLVWKRHRERVDGLVLCAAAAAVSRAAYERVATGVFAGLIEAVSPAPRLCEPATRILTRFRVF